MKREEEIIDAANKYSEYEYNERAANNGFIKGAQWADRNPNKSPWISVNDDLPFNHEELISSEDKRNTFYVIALVHSFVVLSRMEKFEGEWHWTTDTPSYWMPILELPKE